MVLQFLIVKYTEFCSCGKGFEVSFSFIMTTKGLTSPTVSFMHVVVCEGERKVFCCSKFFMM